ncbi:MAG: shikimate kinase, partial [Draconibacterium sp.]
MRIYLIGYMGCGKSTLGKKLAQKLEMQFIDMDCFIEERNYKSIAQIFEGYGEETFRKKEQKALKELSEFTNVVIATGGGAPVFFDNIEVMNQTGITIFIDVTTEELVKR